MLTWICTARTHVARRLTFSMTWPVAVTLEDFSAYEATVGNKEYMGSVVHQQSTESPLHGTEQGSVRSSSSNKKEGSDALCAVRDCAILIVE